MEFMELYRESSLTQLMAELDQEPLTGLMLEMLRRILARPLIDVA